MGGRGRGMARERGGRGRRRGGRGGEGKEGKGEEKRDKWRQIKTGNASMHHYVVIVYVIGLR